MNDFAAPAVNLFIDAGNSRIKWGLRSEAGSWLVRGAVGLAEADDLPKLFDTTPQRIVACNVAGAAVAERLETAFAAHGQRIEWARTGESAGGVRNGYEQPAQLGVDRWAAVVGAWNMERRPCLVVSAGTATTVDLLDRDENYQGIFRGGLILPGYDLMRSSLAGNTAQLPLADGECRELPGNTRDAIVTGCLYAQVGAIERMARRLPQDGVLLLSGGAAETLSACLSLNHRRVDNLVLEGLAWLLP